jgi:hypothetical protein
MKPFQRTVIACILAFGVTGVANAATIITPLLHTDAPGGTLQCNAVNAGTSTISSMTVDITVLGSSVSSGTCTDLLPGHFCQVTTPGPLGAYCTVTFAGSPKKVRAVLQAQDAGNAITSIVEGQ